MPTWTIDPTHAQVEFAVKHMAISTVRGQFKTFTATGETNDAGMPTALTMEIDAASISTNNEQRDGHLVSPTSSTRRISRSSPSRRRRSPAPPMR